MCRERDPMKESHAVAQLGVFRPPLIYLASIATGLALHWAWPRPLMAGGQARPLGGALVVASFLLFAATKKLTGQNSLPPRPAGTTDVANHEHGRRGLAEV